MTKLLTKAFEELQKLPPDRQDELAALVLELVARRSDEFELTPDQEAGVRAAIEQLRRGEFARPEDIDALYAKYGA